MLNNLIIACKNNDAKAQMKLYDTYVKAMYAVASNYVKQTDIVEDIVQESFIKAFKNIDTFTNKVTFGAWLKRIVINNAIDYLRKKKLDLVRIDDSVLNLSNQELDWDFTITYKVQLIKETMQQLSEKYSVVLQLFLLEGYDHQEIASILNISEVASRTQLMRGKNKLQVLLKEKL